MKILVINGSHRKGNTDICIEKLKSFIKSPYAVRVLSLRDYEMKLPDGCEVCAESGICPNIHDQFSKEIEPTIRDYDVYIIATPIWSDNVTPLTKIFVDRIVSWCHKDRMYLKGKKLALIAHGMAAAESWENSIQWVKGICSWEECNYSGVYTFQSSSQIGNPHFDEEKMRTFIENLLNKV